MFTEWDPTADSDLSVLRTVFDSNGDGRLTAAGEFVSTLTSVTSRNSQSIALRHDDDGDGDVEFEWLQRNSTTPVSVSPLPFADFR